MAKALMKPNDITQSVTIPVLYIQVKIIHRGLSWALVS